MWPGELRGSGGLDGFCAVEQGLAAQAAGDVAGFAGGGRGGLVIAQVDEMLGVVEQAMCEVEGGALLAKGC
jgi:hypothetical protein